MTIQELLQNNNMTLYQLSKLSRVPYSTINEIVNGKVELRRCSIETLYKIAQAFHVALEDLVKPYLFYRVDFEIFKSNVCHQLKELGDREFLISVLESHEIQDYFYMKWYLESFYLLAMVDYLSRINHIPLCRDFDFIRSHKLSDPAYPAGVIALNNAFPDKNVLEEARRNSIPEFLHFNLVESEVRNVV